MDFSGSDVIPYQFINRLINEGYKIYSNNVNLLKNNKVLNFNHKLTNLENFTYIITKPGLGSSFNKGLGFFQFFISKK